MIRRPEGGPRSPQALLLALVLASASLITIDVHHGAGSPVDPARQAVAEAFGPAERAATTALRPVREIPAWFESRSRMRHDVARLEADNAELRARVETAGVDRQRLAEFDGLTAAAGASGHALVPARVIALGPSQSFSRTVTIDAGRNSGIRPDQTVINADGLVGRVLRVGASTATVLLIVDTRSVVGGRLGTSQELGFLTGRGVAGDGGRLDLELVDDSVVPAPGEAILTWGSRGGAPYVSGTPVGTVSRVFASVRDGSHRAEIEPFVDFTALDVVGIVVPSGTRSDRAVIEADGSLR